MNMSSLDSQLYDWWLFEEASLERDKHNADVCSHHKRVQLIILDTWSHTTQFVMSICFSFERNFLKFRLPLQVSNQLADQSIESYWATRSFNKNPIKQTDKNHRSEFIFENFL